MGIYNLLRIGMILLMTAQLVNASNQIDELTQLEVNGSRQWVLIRGYNIDNPVVLFIHGGPGSPLMYFSRGFDSSYLNNFTVVHWDQRGSGKSYNPSESISNYNFRQFVADGISVTKQITQKLHVHKVILVGHSWGSILASNMVVNDPSLFKSFITAGTVSDMKAMEQYRYDKVKEEITKSGKMESIEKLKKLGEPPFLTFEPLMEFGNLVIEYMGFEGTFGKLSMDEVNAAVMKNKEYSEQEMASSMEGMKVVFNSLSSFLYSYNALKFVPRLEVPVYFTQGKKDFNTPTELVKNYFNCLDAPKGKKWIEFEDSAHFPFYENTSKFLDVLKESSK